MSQKLNPLIKNEGDIFYHEEYNRIVSAVNDNADQLQQTYDEVFKPNVLIGGGLLLERGYVGNTVVTWKYDRSIKSQTLDGVAIPANSRRYQFTGISTDSTHVLSATTVDDKEVKKEFQIKFVDKTYFFVDNRSELLSLDPSWNSELLDTINNTVSFNCTSVGEHIHVLIPTSIATDVKLKLDGIDITSAFDVTDNTYNNQYGTSVNYKHYCSINRYHSTVTLEIVL